MTHTQIPSSFHQHMHATLQAGGRHTCYLKLQPSNKTNTRQLICWGWNKHGQLDTPQTASHRTVVVALGMAHTCAVLKPHQDVDCWGWDVKGQTDVHGWVKSGVFKTAGIAAGAGHTCAVSRLEEVDEGVGSSTSSQGSENQSSQDDDEDQDEEADSDCEEIDCDVDGQIENGFDGGLEDKECYGNGVDCEVQKGDGQKGIGKIKQIGGNGDEKCQMHNIINCQYCMNKNLNKNLKIEYRKIQNDLQKYKAELKLANKMNKKNPQSEEVNRKMKRLEILNEKLGDFLYQNEIDQNNSLNTNSKNESTLKEENDNKRKSLDNAINILIQDFIDNGIDHFDLNTGEIISKQTGKAIEGAKISRIVQLEDNIENNYEFDLDNASKEISQNETSMIIKDVLNSIINVICFNQNNIGIEFKTNNNINLTKLNFINLPDPIWYFNQQKQKIQNQNNTVNSQQENNTFVEPLPPMITQSDHNSNFISNSQIVPQRPTNTQQFPKCHSRRTRRFEPPIQEGTLVCWGTIAGSKTSCPGIDFRPEMAQHVVQIDASGEHTCLLKWVDDNYKVELNLRMQNADSKVNDMSQLENSDESSHNHKNVDNPNSNPNAENDNDTISNQTRSQSDSDSNSHISDVNADPDPSHRHLLFCWGVNQYGQNDVPPARLHSSVQVSTGLQHTCALGSDHNVHCWGSDLMGQLGVFSEERRGVYVYNNPSAPSAPKDNQSLISVSLFRGLQVRLACGFEHSCAITAGGHLKCWGYSRISDGAGAGNDHQNNSDKHDFQADFPFQDEQWESVALGSDHNCAKLQPGEDVRDEQDPRLWVRLRNGVWKRKVEVMCWGSNRQDQCKIPDLEVQDFVEV